VICYCTPRLTVCAIVAGVNVTGRLKGSHLSTSLPSLGQLRQLGGQEVGHDDSYVPKRKSSFYINKLLQSEAEWVFRPYVAVSFFIPVAVECASKSWIPNFFLLLFVGLNEYVRFITFFYADKQASSIKKLSKSRSGGLNNASLK